MPEFVGPAFIRMRPGLLERKHVDRIGGWPMTLYFWLHTQVRFKGNGAGVTIEPYTHKRAADAMGLPENSVKAWFQLLRKWGYVTTRPVRYGMEVTITKYGPDGPQAGPQRAFQGDIQVSGSRLQGDMQGSPSARQGDTHISPSKVQGDITTSQGDITTSQGDITTSQGDIQGSPSALSIKERAPNKSPRDSRESFPSPPPAPAPSWRIDLADAFAARGLPEPDLDGNEGLAARKLLKANPPELLAQCWQEIGAGEYGDDWLLRNLSFVTLSERGRFNNWLLWKAGKTKAPRGGHNGAGRNGRPNPLEIQDRLYRESLASSQTTRKELTDGPH